MTGIALLQGWAQHRLNLMASLASTNKRMVLPHLTLLSRVHPLIGGDLPCLGQFDHASGRGVSGRAT